MILFGMKLSSHSSSRFPVLLGGASMPTRAQLPRSIADLADRNAYGLLCQQAIDRLSVRIDELERERAAREERTHRARAVGFDTRAPHGPRSSRNEGRCRLVRYRHTGDGN